MIRPMDLETAIASGRHAAAAYVLESADGTYLYKGSCRDLVERLKDHRAGRVGHTKNRRPLRLVHVDYAADYTMARQRENWLKSGAGRDWLKQNARVAEWQTQGTFRRRRTRLWRENPLAA